MPARKSKTIASAPAPTPKSNVPPVSIEDKPGDEQSVKHEDKVYTTVKEGLAYILIPPDAPRLLDPKTHASEPAQSVFYNPIQQYNRDLTVLVIRAFGEDLLARQTLKGKKRRGRRVGQSEKAKEATSNRSETGAPSESQIVQTGVEKTEEPVSKKRQLDGDESTEAGGKRQKLAETPVEPEQLALTKRKLDEKHGAEADNKKQKVIAEAAEFEDDGIDDDDLLAVESSMQENAQFSAAREPAEKGGKEDKPPDEETKLATEEHDKRPQFRILDALSATGLRALRYAQELPFNIQVTANDLWKNAVEAIKLNVKHNRLEKKIKTSVGNANAHMYSFVAQEGTGGPGGKYHVIDIDPYGTAVPFLDAAVQATADNGLLCVTCTDTGVFNSMGYAEKAFALYGGLPGRGDHCHEAGLRLILHAITSTAAKYGIAIEPLLSLSIDYYARVFVRVKRSPADVKFLASKTMLVYSCDHGCSAWTPQFLMRATEHQGKKGSIWYKHSVSQGPSTDRLCECCGSKMHVAGPMYGGPLHNPSFVHRVLDLMKGADAEVYKTLPRVEGMLNMALEEMTIQDLKHLTVPDQLSKQKSQPKVNKNDKAEAANSIHEKVAGMENAAPINLDGAVDAPVSADGGVPAAKTNGNATTTAPATTATEAPLAETSDATASKSLPAVNIDKAPDSDPLPDFSGHMYEALDPQAIDRNPFYIIPSSLSRVLRCQAPSDAAFRGALKGLGHQAVRSHAQPGTIKTDASWQVIWDVMIAWTKQKPIREGALTEGMAGYGILKKAEEREKAREETVGTVKDSSKTTAVVADREPQNATPETGRWKITFDEKLGAEPPKSKRMVRYQINPRANWGPMARAK
jgi:tRNA (guanine26-N2/guanine27-N2)-dimethyltransferase